MAFFAFRRGIIRSLSIPTAACVAGQLPRDRSETRCMFTAPSVSTCGARCLFPFKDPRCSSPCDRPLGHLRTHLCACNPHLLDAAVPPPTRWLTLWTRRGSHQNRPGRSGNKGTARPASSRTCSACTLLTCSTLHLQAWPSYRLQRAQGLHHFERITLYFAPRFGDRDRICS